MPTEFFGTDGIRGEAGTKLSASFALKFGSVFAQYIKHNYTNVDSIIIGRDSRLSSDMLFCAVSAGILEAAVNIVDAGLLATPMLAFYCRNNQLPGVMITASHNPVPDNGLKVFGLDGYKLSRAEEKKIDSALQSATKSSLTSLPKMGCVRFEHTAARDYQEFVNSQIPVSLSTNKLKVVVDCAHGATCGHAEKILADYAEPLVINDNPDGNLINVKCGATCLEPVQNQMKTGRFDLGISFDGDGDRVLFTNRNGSEINGDKIIALLALYDDHYKHQQLAVMTHMTNMGTEEYLYKHGIKLHRTEVGDINVLNAMLANKIDLGGEQSGHIILNNHITTGDGILVAAKVLNLLASCNVNLDQHLADIIDYPSKLTNLRLRDKSLWLTDDNFQASYQKLLHSLSNKVRIYIRPSGTEPVLRVLTESPDEGLNAQAHRELCELFIKHFG